MIPINKKFEIVVPTLFGIEAITANEIRKLGYNTNCVEDGRVTFEGDFEAVCRANVWIRTGERVLIKIGSFKAVTFDELFEGCKALPWADWIPKDGAFPVKGFSVKSALFSVSDCQSIIKKSIVDSLSAVYGIKMFAETGVKYQIEFAIIRDTVTLMIDTSGGGLHKRGYRVQSNLAPVKETIAAALVILSRFSYNGSFADPFCGSGTIPIEAALVAKNIAPGLRREFAAEAFIPQKLWTEAREEGKSLIKHDSKIKILASDIDDYAAKAAMANCKVAGVDDVMSVSVKPVKDFHSTESRGTIVCNPPYGERLSDIAGCEDLARQMRAVYDRLDKWSLCALTSLETFEAAFGKPANKRRKLYNGMIKCNFYQYFQ